VVAVTYDSSDTERELRGLILNLIIDGGEEPFALTYGEMRLELGREPGVDLAFTQLRGLERDGSVLLRIFDGDGWREPSLAERASLEAEYRNWLPHEQDFGELSSDRVGLWVHITAEGIREWRANLTPEYVEPPLWQISGTEDTVIIRAQDEAFEACALESWIRLNDEEELDRSSRSVKPLPHYELRSDRIIENGVEITYRKRRLRQ
jgi:hypothetical protein